MKLSKRVLLIGMALCAAPLVFAGGGGQQPGGTAASAAVMRIDIFDQAANFQGIQPGWFGKIIKDKFNIEINILAPQISGRSLYQSRAAAGSLGDITILDNADFVDCIKSGLLMDISGIIGNYKNLMDYRAQITALNTGVPGAGNKIYGIPTEMTNTSPTAFTSLELFNSPWLPWDYYTETGAPPLKNLNDLLDALEKIQKAHPVNAAGDKAYAITLWPDWDGTSMENINQTVKWYGAEVQGSILLSADGTMKPLTDDNGEYLKLVKFFNAANRRGLVNPDSGTNQWEQSMVPQMQNKQVYLWWYNWQKGFWNNPERGNRRENFTLVPAEDMYFYQLGDSFFGSGRVWSVGSKVSPEKRDRIMQFLDWMASPEGLDLIHCGIKDFAYTVQPDGSYVRTKAGEDTFSLNPPVPAEYGGGGANDGLSKINQWIAATAATNPLTKYPYDWQFWPGELEKAKTVQAREWEAKYGAPDMVAYVKKNSMIGIVPNVNVLLEADTTDIQLIRDQCGKIVTDTSWKMIFAKTDAELSKLWSDMKTQLAGFGWEQLLRFDMKKYQVTVDARAQARRGAR